MEKNKALPAYWAILPAAGVGKRMQSNIPKQYLPLAGKTVIEQTLSIFIQHPLINGIVLSISKGDDYWPDIFQTLKATTDKTILIAKGGQERKDSVLSALLHLQDHLTKQLVTQALTQVSNLPTDTIWTLVHDAARPCLLPADIDKLIVGVKGNIGGLLALPINDTLKRSLKNKTIKQVEKTVCRDNMWRALTPQLFKMNDLITALQQFGDKNITDESSAMEMLGFHPSLIEGESSNIKITQPHDLIQAEEFFELKLRKLKNH
jgi:2-C-methyl-D-erythritol 4-phosphate cytidylyltransferase